MTEQDERSSPPRPASARLRPGDAPDDPTPEAAGNERAAPAATISGPEPGSTGVAADPDTRPGEADQLETEARGREDRD